MKDHIARRTSPATNFSSLRGPGPIRKTGIFTGISHDIPAKITIYYTYTDCFPLQTNQLFMNMMESDTTSSSIVERACNFYLKRQQFGLPGCEHGDRVRTKASFRSHALPINAIEHIGPRVAVKIAARGVDSSSNLTAPPLDISNERLLPLTASPREPKNGRRIELARELA